MLKTFRAKVLFTLLLFIAIGCGGLYIIISNGYKNMAAREGEDVAKMLGASIFQTIRMSMNFGDREIMDASMEEARQIQGIKDATIFRSDIVNEIYSPTEKQTQREDIGKIFKSKEQSLLPDKSIDGFILHKPLIANESCLQCHANANNGDVLGVLELKLSMSNIYEQIDETQNYLLFTMIGAGILAIVGLYFFFDRELVKPLNRLKDMARDLTEGGSGDLTKRISIKSHDEVGVASSYVNRFIETIQNTISLSKGVSEENTRTCLQLSQISTTLSKNSDEQFSAVDKVNQLTQNIDNQIIVVETTTSQTLNDIVETENTLEDFVKNLQDSIALITESAEQQEQVVHYVQDLTEHANNIRAILALIHDISEQTNVLALNASIEAARAGEHGRSFAIVADHVKQLAQRTQKSLGEIESNIGLVSQSISDVQQTITDVTTRMHKITDNTTPLITHANSTKDKLQVTKDNSLKLKDISSTIAYHIRELNEMMETIIHFSSSTQDVGHNVQVVINDMTKKAQSLEKSISKFKT
ncbi:methyl-accepting chemotaxis protein [Helicobacter didelphidarum]|uniref:Methyl-accepting chemotaxis protein n=1 Tax=Helicobacter didelphidarum TaxID=2040648 RepID=A0A3D8IQZ5_9HELI|nr:methyl-accepting chemotaxis protein [Helicobacter didelphidarum]RDU67533.1 methyl-accepting chemotaxis protein [Helicobacter didelphidarum]